MGGSCYEPHDSGLSRFGQTVVEEMNRLGLLVDCSHVGDRTTRQAIDASAGPITATYGGQRQIQEVLSQSSFYSANDLRLHFGLGAADSADLEVRWPNGGSEQFAVPDEDRISTLTEGQGKPVTSAR